MTYIFEILMVSAFQNGKARIYKLNFGWDSSSQLLESLIKMSPDGAHFGHKCFYVWQEAPYQKLASQLFSVLSYTSSKFRRFLVNSNTCCSGLRWAERLIFGLEPPVTPRNIYAQNERHLATFLLITLKAERGYLSQSSIYIFVLYHFEKLRPSGFQKYRSFCSTIFFSKNFH